MRFQSILLAGAALLALSSAASAQDPGWYLGLGVGYDKLVSVGARTNGFIVVPGAPAGAAAVAGSTGRIEFQDSAIYLGSIGYRFASGFRTEVELGFDQHDADGILVYGVGRLGHPPVHGGEENGAVMVNFVYDWAFGNGWGLSLGGGVGAGNVNHYLWVGTDKAIRGTQTALAWQGIAGLNYALSPNTEIFADYRYRGTEVDDDFRAPIAGAGGFVHLGEHREHVGLLGIRWYLGPQDVVAVAPPPPPPPPAPPPPPPAPPAPVKTFIVFFDFDKSNLTETALGVIQQAVTTAKSGTVARIMVTGHTDTVGSDAYNQALSIRRATSVKDEMIREGLDGGSIAIEGRSFHDPLVPTGPGVREPQNRRAVIDLGG